MFSPHSGFLGLQAIIIPHGCETVLVRNQSDIFRSIDDNRCVLLQLPLDLSASINDILSIILSNFERVSSRFNISCLVPTIRFFDCMRCPSPSSLDLCFTSSTRHPLETILEGINCPFISTPTNHVVILSFVFNLVMKKS